jgi:hypothetical protein
VLPIPLPAQGKLGERRAREIRTHKEDPRRMYFRLLHLLSVIVPNSERLKLLEEFEVSFEVSKEIPEVTRRLMIEAIDRSVKQLKITEEKLIELKKKLEVDGE